MEEFMQSIHVKRLIAVLLIFSSMLFVCATGIQEDTIEPYAGREGRITVYISGPAAMISQLKKGFEADHGDVLDIVQMGCGPLRQRVWTEWETGVINADVFWGSDPLIYELLEEQGALEPFVPTELESIRPAYRTDRSYWYVNERYGVIIYSKDTVTDGDVPESFSDLLKPVFKNQVIHADPAQSSTALALIGGMWQLQGHCWDFHKGLVRNGLILTKKNSDVPSKIEEGEFSAGIAPHDAVIRLQMKAKKDGYPTPLEIAWPKEGALAIQRPIAISRNPSRPIVNDELAKDLVDYLLSKPAQQITVKFGFVSVRSDIPKPEFLHADTAIYQIDWDDLKQYDLKIREEFNGLF